MAKDVESWTAESSQLQEKITHLLVKKHIKFGIGPPLALFDVIEPGITDPVHYTYVSLGTDGPRDYDAPSTGYPNPTLAIMATLNNFEKWLQPEKTLVWRALPKVENTHGLFRTHMRCIQIASTEDQFTMVWGL